MKAPVKPKTLITRKRSVALTSRPTARPRIVQVFINADLRGQHRTLSALAHGSGIDTDALHEKQFLVFINKKRNMMKCYVAGNTITFTKRDAIDFHAIQYLPQVFGATAKLDYDEALRISLEKVLAQKKQPELLYKPKPTASKAQEERVS